MASNKVIPEGKYAEVARGLRMHYHDTGRAKKGSVLFIHGSGPGASGWSNFKDNYPVLNQDGYRTIVPDTIGFGYSSMPEDADYGLDALANYYAVLLDQAGVERVSIVGNSHGGALAMRMALRFPQRVEKLILMAPGGLETREVYMEMAGIKAMVNLFFGKAGITREGIREVFKLQLFNQALITDAIVEERYQIAVTQPKAAIGKLKVDNQEDRLGEIQCPVLCFWGVNDQFCPVSGAPKIAARVKNSRTLLISECGHWVMVEYPKLFNETTLRFLNGELG